MLTYSTARDAGRALQTLEPEKVCLCFFFHFLQKLAVARVYIVMTFIRVVFFLKFFSRLNLV